MFANLCRAPGSLREEPGKRTARRPHRRCGKLIVAHDDTEIPALEGLRAKGIANGVQGLEVVDAAYVRAREPNVQAVAALISPNTGILEAEALVRTLARLGTEQGVFLLPGTELTGAEQRDRSIEIATASERIDARSVVNAAGLYADEIASEVDEVRLKRFFTRSDGRWQVAITGAQGSGILRSMSQANGMVLLHHEQGNVAAGEPVDVLPFDGLI